MRRLLALAVAATLVAGAACTRGAAPAASTAPRLTASSVAAIALCTTTEAELRTALGAPARDGVLHRARILSWMAGETEGGVVHYLAVLLDDRGVVVDLYWDVPTEIPWTPTDQCLAR